MGDLRNKTAVKEGRTAGGLGEDVDQLDYGLSEGGLVFKAAEDKRKGKFTYKSLKLHTR